MRFFFNIIMIWAILLALVLTPLTDGIPLAILGIVLTIFGNLMTSER